MAEEMVERELLCNYLRTHKPAMLGVQTPYGKHAVVFAEYDGKYHFMNPTHESSGERTELSFSEEELLAAAVYVFYAWGTEESTTGNAFLGSIT